MSLLIDKYCIKMTQSDKVFFKDLGKRITKYRKDQGYTQLTFGQALNMSQQQIAAFENGTRKVPVSLLPTLTKMFGVTLEALLGQKEQNNKRGPTPKILRQVEQLAYPIA